MALAACPRAGANGLRGANGGLPDDEPDREPDDAEPDDPTTLVHADDARAVLNSHADADPSPDERPHVEPRASSRSTARRTGCRSRS